MQFEIVNSFYQDDRAVPIQLINCSINIYKITLYYCWSFFFHLHKINLSSAHSMCCILFRFNILVHFRWSIEGFDTKTMIQIGITMCFDFVL